MQNREELRQKGNDVSRKTTCRVRGKNIIFGRGGGINIVLKYRPLQRPIPAICHRLEAKSQLPEDQS
jgi:hypothetical protein